MSAGNATVMLITPFVTDEVRAFVMTATRITLIILEVSLTKWACHHFRMAFMVYCRNIRNHTSKI